MRETIKRLHLPEGVSAMIWRPSEPKRVFARGISLRRSVAYSLAVVRIILVPVIVLAIYYLFAMHSIVDRIVSEDAPVATLANRISFEMLEVRRAEKNYFLLHDPQDLEENRQALSRLEQIVSTCRELRPDENSTFEEIQTHVDSYRDNLEQAVARLAATRGAPAARIREVILAYKRGLDDFLRHARRQSRAQLLEELHSRVGSLDAQIVAILQMEDPALGQISRHLQDSSNAVLGLAADLEKRSWNRVLADRTEARSLLGRAEWVLGIVSLLTLMASIWVSFILPRRVVKPLVELKEAVDHATSGNYQIEFDLQGESEVVALANSVRSLIAHVREARNSSEKPMQQRPRF